MILSAEELTPFSIPFPPEAKLVLTGGCFDTLHPAHRKFLKQAKQEGDMLIVLLESDKNISKMKGEDRPKHTQKARAHALEAYGFIDYIILLPDDVNDEYYYNLTKLLQPAIIAITHGDPLTGKKREQAEAAGGKLVEVMKRDPHFSSSKIIKS